MDSFRHDAGFWHDANIHFPMPRITFSTAFDRCALAWEEAGATRFSAPGGVRLRGG
jgi:hypothetical protein